MANKAALLNPRAKFSMPFRSAWPYIAIFSFALTLRLIYLFEIIDQPIISILLGDAESYDAWAQEIVKSGWIGERTFYQAPFYPYFLALIYTIGIRDFILVRVVQALIGAISCVLLAGAGARYFDKRTGWLAGALLSLYAPALYFDLLLQKAVLGMFFMCLLLFLLSKATQQSSDKLQPGVWIGVGVALACFGLVRENALILLPVIGTWLMAYYWKSGWQHVLLKGACVFLGLTIVFFPVTLRNYVVGGEFILTTSQMGPNFFIGNSAEATGYYRPLIWDRSDWKFERVDAQNLAEQALGRALTPKEVSDYWLGETLNQIQQDPLRWLRLMGKKWLLTWNAVEISDSESIYAHYRNSTLLRAAGTVFNFGVLCSLAVIGIFFSRQSWKQLWGLYAVWFCFAASVALFFVFDRYRHPMAAVMLLFAAVGLSRGLQYIKERRFQPLAAGDMLTLPFAVMINWPMVSKAKIEAPTYFNIGYELEQRGELARAKDFYLTSLSMDESNPLVLNNLGVVAMKQDRPADAIRHFTAAVEAKPNNWDARVNLGIVLWGMGRKDEAVLQYEQVLRAVPDYNPSLYYNIACFHALGGRINEGLSWLRKAIEHGYDKWELLYADPDLDNLRHRPEFAEILQKR